MPEEISPESGDGSLLIHFVSDTEVGISTLAERTMEALQGFYLHGLLWRR